MTGLKATFMKWQKTQHQALVDTSIFKRNFNKTIRASSMMKSPLPLYGHEAVEPARHLHQQEQLAKIQHDPVFCDA
jgi:hypothetical protein